MIIKHNRAMEVAFRVWNKSVDAHGMYVKGVWVIMGYNKSWYIPVMAQTFYIFKKDLKNWKVTELSKNACIRYNNWRSL